MVFILMHVFWPNFDDEDVETRTGDDRNDSLKELRVDESMVVQHIHRCPFYKLMSSNC